MIVYDLQHARADTLQLLCALVFCADLCKIERVAHFVLYVLSAGAKRPQCVAEPNLRASVTVVSRIHAMLSLAYAQQSSVADGPEKEPDDGDCDSLIPSWRKSTPTLNADSVAVP